MLLYKLSGAREDMGGIMHEDIVFLNRKWAHFLENREEVKRITVAARTSVIHA